MLSTLATYISGELGKDTPWHITGLDPKSSWKLENNSGVDYGKLIKIASIAEASGLLHAYLPFSKTSPQNNTFCLKCQDLLIERNKGTIRRNDEQGACQKCGTKLSGVI
jgi:hypothetical protein